MDLFIGTLIVSIVTAIKATCSNIPLDILTALYCELAGGEKYEMNKDNINMDEMLTHGHVHCEIKC